MIEEQVDLTSYTLTELEDQALLAHANWDISDNPETKNDLFVSIKNLSKSVITLLYSKSNIDFELASYEYSVYLFQRIILRTLDLNNHNGRFPLQHYMRKNVRHIIYSQGNEITWMNVVNEMDDEEFENEIEDIHSRTVPQEVNCKNLSRKMYDGLGMFYNHEDIKRLYPICRDLFYSNRHCVIPYGLPEDIKNFMMILISLAKRVYVDNKHIFEHHMKDTGSKEFKKRIQSALRSTIFFSAITKSEVFPKELLLALDVDSLYRLVSICGGNTIRIPKERELESLMGAVVTISNMVLDGQDMETAIFKAKKDYGLVMDNRINIRDLIHKVNCTIDLENDAMSEPMLNMLEKLVKFFDVIVGDLSRLERISSPDLLRLFTNVSDSITNLTDNVFTIKTRIENSCNTSEVIAS